VSSGNAFASFITESNDVVIWTAARAQRCGGGNEPNCGNSTAAANKPES
jgi:hypothetical protein